MIWKIFVLFSRVALFSWGGGPASLALMQREVTAVGWSAALAGGWDKILIVAATFVLLTATRVNPVFVILGAALLGFAVYR